MNEIVDLCHQLRMHMQRITGARNTTITVEVDEPVFHALSRSAALQAHEQSSFVTGIDPVARSSYIEIVGIRFVPKR